MSTENTFVFETVVPVPPDGGYGWLIVGAAFLAHVITHGILYSFGVLFITIEERFGGSKADVSWILSTATGMLYLVGPLAGYLADRYGIRMVTILGTFLGSIGYFTSMFVSQLRVLYITLGFLTGCGFGMVFLGAIVIVTLYFDKRRSLASGIALSGAGSGAFIFSPLMKQLTNTFSWRGTTLIISGLILNCVACGLIFKPLTSYETKTETSTKQIPKDSISVPEKEVKKGTNDVMDLNDGNAFHKNLDITGNRDVNAKRIYSAIYGNIKEEMAPLKAVNLSVETNDSMDNVDEGSANSGERHEYVLKHDENTCTLVVCNRVDKHPFNDSVELTDSKQDGCDKVHEQTGPLVLYPDTRIAKTDHNQTRQMCPTFTQQFELFKSKVFVMFVISQFLFFIGFYQPFFYIPDKAKQSGISEGNAVWAVSTIGICSIFGRIVLGYIADRPSVNRLLIFGVALLIAGLSTALGPLFRTTWSLFLYAPVYGISTGIILSLTPVVLGDLLGVNRLANAFGINNFFCGAASFIGPPLAGLLYDLTSNYGYSFITAGLSMTASGLLIFLVKCTQATSVR